MKGETPGLSRKNVKVTLTGNHVAPMTETDQFGAFARRVLRAYARRVADRDIEGLAGLVALRDEVDTAIQTAVDALQGNPYSWAEIGHVLGVTRQAAQQRYGRRQVLDSSTDH
jgi:hypothetical protein